MKRLIAIGLLVSGCTASLNPFPGVSAKEFNAAMQQLQANDQLLAQKIAEITPKPKQVEKK